MISRTDEIKNIMRQLRDSKNESVLNRVNEDSEDVNTENDASESDLLLARLEDIISRFEKVIAAAVGEAPAEDEEPIEDEEPTEDEAPAEDEEPNEDEAPAEDEEPAEESYQRSLEKRLAALERRFTESRRRSRCSRFYR